MKNKNNNHSKHIHIMLDKRRITVRSGKRKTYKLLLEDSIPITDVSREQEIPPMKNLMTIEGLMSYRKIPKKGNIYILEVYYHGTNESERYLMRGKVYKNTLDRQPCLLLALCNAEDRGFSIDSAYRILEDKKRCRRRTRALDKFQAVHWVIKNLRKEVGFTPQELYISQQTSTVGIRAIH